MKPRFMYFDLGNVLCFFDHAQSASQMAEVAGVTAADMRAIVYESDLEHRYEAGLITSEEFVREVEQAVGRKLDQAAFLEAASAMFTANLSIEPILERIRNSGIVLGLLSNTNIAHWEWIRRQRYSVVEGWFDPIVLSFEVKAMKPQRAIYDIATARAGVDPHQIFFTDDRADNVAGAEQHGWRCHRFIDTFSLQQVVDGWC